MSATHKHTFAGDICGYNRCLFWMIEFIGNNDKIRVCVYDGINLCQYMQRDDSYPRQ